MRLALWLVALFGVAVASALFAGNNQGTVTLFWPPYRIDLSLNLVVAMLTGFFVILYVALRALSSLLALPVAARRWRISHYERNLNIGLLETLTHLMAGRFLRSRKAALGLLETEAALARHEQVLPYAGRLRTMAHLLAGESAHALQDRVSRDEHLRQGLTYSIASDALETQDSLKLRAARWAFDDRDVPTALQRLDELPQGAARRTLALRLRFKVARLAGQSRVALEMSRLLIKHRAFSPLAGQSIVKGLVLEMIQGAHDPEQLNRVWSQFEPAERMLSGVAVEATDRLLKLDGEVQQALSWLLPVWENMIKQPGAIPADQKRALFLTLEQCFSGAHEAPELAWLTRIESAQMNSPRDPLLMYLASVICMRLNLWGKSQQMLQQALPLLKDEAFERNAWRTLALLAEQREDPAAAAQAWRNAAVGSDMS